MPGRRVHRRVFRTRASPHRLSRPVRIAGAGKARLFPGAGGPPFRIVRRQVGRSIRPACASSVSAWSAPRDPRGVILEENPAFLPPLTAVPPVSVSASMARKGFVRDRFPVIIGPFLHRRAVCPGPGHPFRLSRKPVRGMVCFAGKVCRRKPVADAGLMPLRAIGLAQACHRTGAFPVERLLLSPRRYPPARAYQRLRRVRRILRRAYAHAQMEIRRPSALHGRRR